MNHWEFVQYMCKVVHTAIKRGFRCCQCVDISMPIQTSLLEPDLRIPMDTNEIPLDGVPHFFSGSGT